MYPPLNCQQQLRPPLNFCITTWTSQTLDKNKVKPPFKKLREATYTAAVCKFRGGHFFVFGFVHLQFGLFFQVYVVMTSVKVYLRIISELSLAKF